MPSPNQNYSQNPKPLESKRCANLTQMIANTVTKPQTPTLKTPRESGDEPDEGGGGEAIRQVRYSKDICINAEP